MWRKLCGVASCLTIAAGVAANSDTNSTVALTLPPLTVTASPVIEENRLTPLAGQVTSVAEQQIRELAAQDLPSALRRTPGVVISRYNPVGSFGGAEGGGIFIRGMGASRPGAEVVVLMDGIPRFVGLWTHPLMDTLSIDNAARLDVYKGAQPVLLGNMAFGAVDMITKRRTDPGYVTALQLAYGSFDTWIETAEHGGNVAPVDYFLVQSYRRSGGHRNNADGELQNYFGRVAVDIGEHWNVGALYHRTDNFSEDPGDVRTGRRQGRFDTTTDFTVFTLANRYDGASGWVKVYWEHGAIDWIRQFNSATGSNDVTTLTRWDNYGFKARETFLPWEGSEWTVGLDLDFISGRASNRTPPGGGWRFPQETFYIWQPYGLIRHRFDLGDGVWLEPSAGVRGFFHNNFDNEVGPQAGVVLQARQTRWHFGYARGVNYPGVYVKTFARIFLPGDNREDLLDAEVLNHFEAGLRQEITSQFTFDLTGFVDRGAKRIVLVPPPPPPPVYRNLGEFDTYGVELMGTWRPWTNLAIMAGGTWLQPDPGTLPYCPKWTVSAGITWRMFDRWQLSVDGSFVDDHFAISRARNASPTITERVSDYFLLSARVAYEVPIPWEWARLELFLAGENLTDTNYAYRPGYPMPGINAVGGARVMF